MSTNNSFQICTRGVWDSTIPGIEFDENGVSNYSKMFDRLIETFPRGESGHRTWLEIVDKIKTSAKNNNYDCLVGVSGGTDSSYLLHLAKQYGLRPLAVNLDNGWNTDISVRNIKKVTSKLKIDLETYVINYEEIKDILRSYMRASLPWIDIPTDLAIKSSLYRIAAREGVKYILRGNDFRSEGTQPREWTYGDGKQLVYIQKKYGTHKLKTFPNYTLGNLIYFGYLRQIKSIYPFYYLDYQKKSAQQLLQDEYDWHYYGGHHHENIFTKFAICYWLRKKFNIDKRKITFSAQILTGEISRKDALQELQLPPYDPDQMERDKDFTLKKLDLTEAEFQTIMRRENKYFYAYPSHYPLIQKFIKTAKPVLSLVLPHKPMAIFQIEMRDAVA
ncbi:MAG: N-acetyl sugar amidotransferase [Bacteroidetes bacterium]|nr:N-acetyl sugar amidotransferase [Bacteroidota bacterium]